jgi:flagellar basal-body rod protein FlgG
MDRGLYIAASGMLAELVQQDQIANDLANASTPGYKADRSAERSFGDLLLANQKDGSLVGPLSLGTHVDTIATDLSQAPLRETDGKLDVGLEGDGFLAVRTANGVRYTRDGQLSLDAQGRLVTATAQEPVLDQQGREIVVGSNDPTIAPDGTIQVGNRAVARIGVFSLANPQKVGDNEFTGTAGARPAATQVRQGFLETAGVDPARTMVDMIASLRAYEASQRVLHAIDDSLGKAVQAGATAG